MALRLGLRQPQASKHLQALERAGLASLHPLGQRRIYALRREPLRALGTRLGRFGSQTSSEAVLASYAEAVQAEESLAAQDPDWAVGRVVLLARDLHAPVATVWAHWTTRNHIRVWWSPEHFEVVSARVEPIVGGPLEVTMREGDGTTYLSRGRFLKVRPPTDLRFEFGPLGPDGNLLLSATHDLHLRNRGEVTQLSLTVRITSATPAAAPMVAGLGPGWEQLLDRLSQALSRRAPTADAPQRKHRRPRS